MNVYAAGGGHGSAAVPIAHRSGHARQERQQDHHEEHVREQGDRLLDVIDHQGHRVQHPNGTTEATIPGRAPNTKPRMIASTKNSSASDFALEP